MWIMAFWTQNGVVNLMVAIESDGDHTNDVKIVSNQTNKANRYNKDENEKAQEKSYNSGAGTISGHVCLFT